MTGFWAAAGPMVVWAALTLVGWVALGVAGVPRRALRLVASLPAALLCVVLVALLQTKVPLPFGWPAIVGAALSVGALAAGLGAGWRLLRRPAPPPRTPEPSESIPIVLLALAGSAALGFFVMWLSGGARWDIASQTWDSFFDANAVRAAWETGRVDPIRISDFAYTSPFNTYYPSFFHALAVLVMQATGADAVSATNVTAGLIAGAIWPPMVALATGYLFGGSRRILLPALVLAWGFHGMPWSPLGWGVLWATGLAATAVPLAIALFAGMLGVTRVPRNRVRATGLFVASLILVAVMHPRIGVVTATVLIVPWMWVVGGSARAAWQADRRGTAFVGVVLVGAPLVVLAGAGLWVGRSNAELVARAWPILQGRFAELLQYAIGGAAQSVPQLLVAALVAVGVVAAWRTPQLRWLVLLFVAAVAIDVVTATTIYVRPINAVARFWYNDRHRTIVVPPAAAVPLAVLGLEWVRTVAAQRLSWARWRTQVVAGLAAVTMVWGAWGGLVYLRPTYSEAAADPRLSFVSPADIEFYAKVADLVTPGQRVLNNPWDGSGLLYAYTGVRPVFMLLNGTSSTYNGVVMRDGLLTMTKDDACLYLKADSVHWVLNGGPVSLSNPELPPQVTPGMDIPSSGLWALTLVLEEGDRRLYRVTGCGAY